MSAVVEKLAAGKLYAEQCELLLAGTDSWAIRVYQLRGKQGPHHE